MKPSIDRIRTTHTGSLPRPADMLEALHARFEGGSVGDAAYEKALVRNVREIVRKQVEAGIDIVSDGECSKPSFMAYRAERIGGFEPRVPKGGMPAPGPVDPNGRDATLFPEYYRNMLAHSPFANTVRVAPRACGAPNRGRPTRGAPTRPCFPSTPGTCWRPARSRPRCASRRARAWRRSGTSATSSCSAISPTDRKSTRLNS